MEFIEIFLIKSVRCFVWVFFMFMYLMNALHCARHFTTGKKKVSPAPFTVYTLCIETGMGNIHMKHFSEMKDCIKV